MLKRIRDQPDPYFINNNRLHISADHWSGGMAIADAVGYEALPLEQKRTAWR
jgi:hypothetical protein